MFQCLLSTIRHAESLLSLKDLPFKESKLIFLGKIIETCLHMLHCEFVVTYIRGLKFLKVMDTITCFEILFLFHLWAG